MKENNMSFDGHRPRHEILSGRGSDKLVGHETALFTGNAIMRACGDCANNS